MVMGAQPPSKPRNPSTRTPTPSPFPFPSPPPPPLLAGTSLPAARPRCCSGPALLEHVLATPHVDVAYMLNAVGRMERTAVAAWNDQQGARDGALKRRGGWLAAPGPTLLARRALSIEVLSRNSFARGGHSTREAGTRGLPLPPPLPTLRRPSAPSRDTSGRYKPVQSGPAAIPEKVPHV